MTLARRIVPALLLLVALLLAVFILINVLTPGPAVGERWPYFAICFVVPLIAVISAFAQRRLRRR